MYIWRLLLYTTILLLLCGCMPNDQAKHDKNHTVSLTKVSTKNNEVNQQISNDIKQMLSNHPHIESAHAVNSKEDIIIAVKVINFDRFQLDKIEKNIKNKVKKKYDRREIFVSTDQKIILEVEKLEKKLASTHLTKEKLEKKIKEIIQLGKEQT